MATPLQLLGISGSEDRVGITTVTIPFNVDTLMEAIAFVPDIPGFTFPFVSRTFQQIEDGTYEVQLTAEGSPTNQSEDQYKVFEFDGSMNEDPIKTHPKFEDLKNQFGWDEALGTFKEFGTSGDKPGLSGKSSTPKKSKMYGVESWLNAGAIYRVSYSLSTMPASIFSGIGTVQTPPGVNKFSLPNLGARNWLKLIPKVKMRGSCIEVSLEYMLSGPLGWYPEVYGQAQLTDSSGGDHNGSMLTVNQIQPAH